MAFPGFGPNPAELEALARFLSQVGMLPTQGMGPPPAEMGGSNLPMPPQVQMNGSPAWMPPPSPPTERVIARGRVRGQEPGGLSPADVGRGMRVVNQPWTSKEQAEPTLVMTRTPEQAAAGRQQEISYKHRIQEAAAGRAEQRKTILQERKAKIEAKRQERDQINYIAKLNRINPKVAEKMVEGVVERAKQNLVNQGLITVEQVKGDNELDKDIRKRTLDRLQKPEDFAWEQKGKEAEHGRAKELKEMEPQLAIETERGKRGLPPTPVEQAQIENYRSLSETRGQMAAARQLDADTRREMAQLNAQLKLDAQQTKVVNDAVARIEAFPYKISRFEDAAAAKGLMAQMTPQQVEEMKNTFVQTIQADPQIASLPPDVQAYLLKRIELKAMLFAPLLPKAEGPKTDLRSELGKTEY